MGGAGEARLLGAAMLGAAAVLPVLPAVGVLCPLRRVTGVPCPLCGMTTGVVAAVGGDWAAAAAANPAAPLLVLAVLAAWTAWGLRWARRRFAAPAGVPAVGGGAPASLSRWPAMLARRPWWLPVPPLAAMWLFQLHRFGHLG